MHSPVGISTVDRAKNLARCGSENFDVLVIGGGIMGAGIALDAASRNLKVLLLEKQDFAAGTSSRSTKLIHGGLRYLKNLEFGLVRTVARERKVLQHLAPHLVTPEPMLLPVLEKTSYGNWATALGLTLYEFLGQVPQRERHQMLSPHQTLHQEPLLNPAGLRGGGLFTEYRTDDARLTLEVLKTASHYGALCLNYVSVREFTYSEKKQVAGALVHDELSGQEFTVKANCVVNAAGPWSAGLMHQDQPINQPVLFHTKGVHLVVPYARLPLRHAVYFDIAGGRMLFAIPRYPVTYLGTTDTPYSGNLTNPPVTAADLAYLLTEINRLFPTVNLTGADVVSSWAGVRPLIFEPGKSPTEISRKDEIFVSKSGLLTVAGGKLTGYRHLSEAVVNKLQALCFSGRTVPCQTRTLKLLAGNFTGPQAVATFVETCTRQAAPLGLTGEQVAALVRTYGTAFSQILDRALTYSTQNPNPENCLLKAQVWYAIHAEGAVTISDFLIRRTGMLYFERPRIENVLPAVAAAFQEMGSLNNQALEEQLTDFETLFDQALTFENAETTS